MNIYIMDKNFEIISVIDAFKSFIWTDRYNAYGDCEIYTFVNLDILADAQLDNYLWMEGSERLMFIDERRIESDVESGAYLTIVGKSLEKILDRRIVWNQTILKGNLQSAIQKLLNENVINPSISGRKIDNFIFEASTDPRITTLTIDRQYTGTNLYDAINGLCAEQNIGFKVILNDNNQFVFSLYKGEDRSYDQEQNPFVVFSPEFENIINSNYLESNGLLKNVGLVAGEGEGADRRTVTIGTGSGLNRREDFIDARDVSSSLEDGETMSDSEYRNQLSQRGKERIAESKFVQTFEGAVETTQTFVYGTDFFLGDVVQLANEYKIEASARIEEIIFSFGNDGNTIVPTFSVIPWEGEDG